MKALVDMNVWQGAMQIFAALESPALQLLHNSIWKKIDKKYQTIYQELKFKFKSENNYKNYRDILVKLHDTPCVPFMGAVLSNITFVSFRPSIKSVKSIK